MQVTTQRDQYPETCSRAVRILIVDDEAYIRDVLTRWLTAEGYHCDRAARAGEAAGLLQENSYDLLLCDITMPGASGVDLLRSINGQNLGVATIMVTAVDDREIAIHTVKLGAYGYIIKPFERNEVIINVTNALERRRLALAAQEYGRRLEQDVRDRTADVRRREEEIALRLVSASEYRDEETGAHIRRIGQYASTLAEALGWDSQMVDDVRVAAPMHDIGKIGVPDTILLKPGKLTIEEFEIVKQHTEIGAKILDGTDVSLLKMAKSIALHHHEKWDGSGYPQRLSGEDIPAAARLVALTDVYDALTTDRVYRPAMSEPNALAIMEEGRGRHFDPVMFGRFLDVRFRFTQIRQQVGVEAGHEEGKKGSGALSERRWSSILASEACVA